MLNLLDIGNIIEATPFEFGFDSNSEFSQCFPIGDLEIETKWTAEGAIIRIGDTSDNKYVLSHMGRYERCDSRYVQGVPN